MQPYPSPLENLASYALAFIAGFLSAVGLGCQMRQIRHDAETTARPRQQPPTPEQPSEAQP
jgi:hypothetical protein